MAVFELFIPASDPQGFNVTARVRADSWMQALRSGLTRLGDTADVQNVIVDITEAGIDVTEPNSGRVFRIRELEDSSTPPGLGASPGATTPGVKPQPASPTPSVAPPSAAAPNAAPTLAGAGTAATPRPPMPQAAQPAAKVGAVTAPAAAASKPAKPPSQVPPRPSPVTAQQRAAPPVHGRPPGAAPGAPTSQSAAPARPPQPAPHAAAPVRAATPRFVAQVQEEAVTQQAATTAQPAIGRTKQDGWASNQSDDLISELFAQTQVLYDKPDLRAAAEYILELAMHSVRADAGAVFISDISASDLYFAAARGPKGQEAMKFRVPMGQGIVGFCAQEGVALAVSDVHRDPRFYATISRNIGYETRSILCAPAQIEGRVFGAIELINKREGTSFTGGEMNVLNFLAHEFADYIVNTGQTGD